MTSPRQEETFSVNFLLDFLSLCESSGFIQLKLPLSELKKKLVDLWSEILPTPICCTSSTASCNATPSPASKRNDTSENGVESGREDVSSTARCNNAPSLANKSSDTSENGVELGKEDTVPLDDLNWTILTPDVSCTSVDDRSSETLDGGVEEERERDGAENDMVAAEESRVSRTPEYSPAFVQPDFDDLSTASNTDRTISPTASPLHTPSSPQPHPLSPALPHTPTSSSYLATPSSSNTADDVETNSLENERGSLIQLPSVEQSKVVVIDSSDDEADTKLENLFADMRLQSTKKKNISSGRPSRKSLSIFIVSDSDEESVEEDATVEGSSSSFQTPRGPPPRCKTPLTPFTPYTALVFWGSPGENSSSPPKPHRGGHCITAPPVANRHPLTEKNHTTYTPYTPGTPSKVVAPQQSLPTTPSAHKTFSRHKRSMAQELFSLFNHTVFDNELPADMELIWNSKLRTTAGYCRNSGTLYNRRSKIELSMKVIDSYERLKNTLIHEMCHAAVWLINGVKNGGHKRQWQAWALKANTTHPDLDTITRCHNYDISYKYSYKCTRCDYKLGRHSKSVNLTTSRCPFCLSQLELEPRLNPDGTPMSVKLNRYAQFVKEHYAEVKHQTPQGGHKAVMQKLRENYYSSSKTPTLEN